jgi:hypothetical protein
VKAGDVKHTLCAKKVGNMKVKPEEKTKPNFPMPVLRSESTEFDAQTQCILCETAVSLESKEDKAFILKAPTKNQLYKKARLHEDDWGTQVISRFNSEIDILIKCPRYHQQCNINFRNNKFIPTKYQQHEAKRKSPPGFAPDELKQKAFLKTITWFENSEEEVKIPKLVEVMSNFHQAPFSRTYMRQKLTSYYGQDITLIQKSTKPTVVVLSTSRDSILETFYSSGRNNSPNHEKFQIIEAAAQLIADDINSSHEFETGDKYPSADVLTSKKDLIPDSLKMLLQGDIGQHAEVRVLAIGQSIMQAARPRSLIMLLRE